ncbi:sugar phosphate isomerase/epimerase [Paenibacillus sp. MSJ-34]|uniref:sugar phosphate isomerase/epimerase family protein n=1 Tax=Paenibacillus sp. MSJ-34 TaxID=2841529 RepID=UPI001C12855B|nr:sugar phosphate isomerase/epimerase family protein [Paenibacillus sp. MSJ-34]MBU5441925.1 sugar phosphate isomerase/epimerase [Paenibacillus sp. MSJ-34]
MTYHNRYSVSTYAMIEEPLEDAVHCLVNEGWKAIEIMGEGRHDELLEWPQERLRSLQEIGKANGISWTIHTPITACNPAAVTLEEVAASMNIMLRTLRIADLLGCDFVVLHAGRLDDLGEDAAQPAGTIGGEDELAAVERVAAFVRRALEETAGSKVKIALENIPPYPRSLGADVEFLLRVLERVNSPRAGIVFDAGHAHLVGEGYCLEALPRVLPHAVALHLSDNRGEYDDHYAIGQGSVPIGPLTEMAVEYGYAGAWILEMHSVADADASARVLDRMRTASIAAIADRQGEER